MVLTKANNCACSTGDKSGNEMTCNFSIKKLASFSVNSSKVS